MPFRCSHCRTSNSPDEERIDRRHSFWSVSSWWLPSTHSKKMRKSNWIIFPTNRDENNKSLSCHHIITLPETNIPKSKHSSSNHQFSGAMLVWGRVPFFSWLEPWGFELMPRGHKNHWILRRCDGGCLWVFLACAQWNPGGEKHGEHIHRIHVWYIYPHLRSIFMVNVDKYTVHGWHGYWNCISIPFILASWWLDQPMDHFPKVRG